MGGKGMALYLLLRIKALTVFDGFRWFSMVFVDGGGDELVNSRYQNEGGYHIGEIISTTLIFRIILRIPQLILPPVFN